MSTRTTISVLTAHLVDDAAVFPPGSASVERAWIDYLDRRSTRYAAAVGPLLMPISSVAALADVADRAPAAAVPVVLIARPGTPTEEVARALHHVHELKAASVALIGVEVAHQDGWQQALGWGVGVVVEVPAARSGQHAALEEIAGTGARAKLRTQSTSEQPVPNASALADFVAGCAHRGIAFKLTGGLHRAVAHTSSAPDVIEERHGVLNVMIATQQALAGDPPAALTAWLVERNPQRLVAAVEALTEGDVAALRESFTSFGCCGVLDPLSELEDLNLLSHDEEVAR